MESHTEDYLNKLTDSDSENSSTQLYIYTESELDSSATYSSVYKEDSEDSIEEMKVKPKLKSRKQIVSPATTSMKQCLICKRIYKDTVGLMKRDIKNMRTCRLFLLVGMRKPLCSFCRSTLNTSANNLRLQTARSFPRDIWNRRNIKFCLLCGSRCLLRKVQLGFMQKFMLRELIHKTIAISDVEKICHLCLMILADLDNFYGREMLRHVQLGKRIPKVLMNGKTSSYRSAFS